MKGIICEEVDRFRLTEHLPEPELAKGEAIVRIRRIGICGTDYHAFKGNQPFFSYPRILGHELAGVIEAVSEGAAGLSEGDTVAIVPYMHCGQCVACRNGKSNCCSSMKVLGVHIDGGMRERLAVPVSHLLPAHGLDLDQVAVVEPLAIGAHAVRRAEPKQGENVLVIGAGPIGLGVMAFAKYAGARVIAMDVNKERLQFCRSWANVDAVVNALNNPLEALSELTGGEYPTIVFDATGNARSMTDSFQYVAHGGKLVYVGLVKADISFNDPEFHKREMTLMGSRNATREDFEYVLKALRSGSIDVERYITHRAPFDDMIGEFERIWLKPESKVIKAMVEL
ncbi:zinc-binding alcohol dehydrogenase family protein [Cohnella faecalis]|uniref:Zinc-binding alcohol dehydrogenase family protein n=1 Tax=Cohnella faecalis TaxID=2315694 RepID=A0A398CJZ5_9BACL|nr:zinc-binding alcohol dehydrogenase family protein [Cohnella faecalis]RIE03023.1 zinc-binding alcohol dehydrogenase family protein [Cohnella faecalis]